MSEICNFCWILRQTVLLWLNSFVTPSVRLFMQLMVTTMKVYADEARCQFFQKDFGVSLTVKLLADITNKYM